MGSARAADRRLFSVRVVVGAIIALQFSGATDSPAARKKLVEALLHHEESFECSVKSPNAAEIAIWWQFQQKNLTTSQDLDRLRISVSKSSNGTVTSHLTIGRVSWEDGGTYTCLALEVLDEDEDAEPGEPTKQDVVLEIYAEAKKLGSSDGSGAVGQSAVMSCVYQGKPLPAVKWLRHGKTIESDAVKYNVSGSRISHNEIESFLEIRDLTHADNGTYLCHGENDYNLDVAVVDTVVFDKPVVELDMVKAVGVGKIYVNWTVTDWNSPVVDYFLFHRKISEEAWIKYIDRKIPTDATSFVIEGLDSSTDYHVKLSAKNGLGEGESSIHRSNARTLSWSPTAFVPSVGLKGLTWNSISIGWNPPPEDSERDYYEYLGYYKLTRSSAGEGETTTVYQDVTDYTFYLWRDLRPATVYRFSVSACNGFTRGCGAESNVVTGTTEDGLSGEPSNIGMDCHYDAVSRMNFVQVFWDPPAARNGKIEFYNVELKGASNFLDKERQLRTTEFGPEVKTVDASKELMEGEDLRTRFDFLMPNTNYTASICAVTRLKECGKPAIATCKMRPLPPNTLAMMRFQWSNGRSQGRDVFKLKTPKLSQLSGPICCFRVVVVRMESGARLRELPPRASIRFVSYRKAHETGSSGGVYVAEILGPNSLGTDVIVGDGQNVLAAAGRSVDGSRCPQCRGGVHTQKRIFARNVAAPATELVEDGFLDPDSNYTAYVEVIVPGDVGRSPFMIPHKPGETVYALRSSTTAEGGGGKGDAVSTVLICILGFLGGLVTVAVLLLVTLLFLRSYSKQVAAAQNVEMNMMRSLRHFIASTLRGGARDHSQYLITPSSGGGEDKADGKARWKPADVAPIAKDDLVAAYLERHKDSDYGFQAEFELLPDRFPDRTTTEACDLPSNRLKNRYPDIKCYDQTRVKLLDVDPPTAAAAASAASPTSSGSSSFEDSSAGSSSASHPDVVNDYINANFVQGYKDRKTWICAQGPLEHTVADFWRMIHEQGAAMVIMLTNLEEYSRVKCAQYWPGAGDSTYTASPSCAINVRFCTEKRYSDYVVRELAVTVTKQRKKKDDPVVETRTVKQFHYLQWKDFNAPEHAPGMLRFVKRVNEEHNAAAASSSSSPPIVVHCSAGVGRSGTLIAIDSLMQMLVDEGQVDIYKLVCELRHSRNYLVQSVKQYMFVYRAIMEMGQFGDTEIDSSELKPFWTKISDEHDRLGPANDSKSKLREEFAKLANIVDDRKALSVGANEENRRKNQSEQVIPFDRNRVILTPDGMKPHSTYINASFIEGYHNDESFIITQDPMPDTVEDFWRMVSEHCIQTVVQLTGRDDEAWPYYPTVNSANQEHGSMRVGMENKEEEFTSYTMRELAVYNAKADETVKLTHFAFRGWAEARSSSSSDDDEATVPDDSQGLLDLIEHATAHKAEKRRSGPIAVHCKYGSDRSSVYVALSCLVQQLKTESRADVFSTVRKLRSQRQRMVRSLSQYKFIYRAVCDYVDLYNSRDDEEYQYSIPVNSVGPAKV